MNTDRIPTETLQIFSAAEAWDYRIVPYEYTKANHFRCYGESGKDYSKSIEEIAVIYGIKISISEIEKPELECLLNRYYRKEQTSSPKIGILGMEDGDFINALIEEADNNNASDIHFEAYEERCRIRFRIDGKLIERYVVRQSNYPALVNRLKILANLDISEKRLPQDGRILYSRNNKKFDVRVSALPTIYGEKIVLRLLTRHSELLELGNLGFSDRQLKDYRNAIRNPNGLVLISGPTGSGKSTTLYATLRLLNREDNNILTIEDPVEYTLPGINQVQLKEEIGLTFGSALRTFLRQDPDIIMLGEIRDTDTAQMAIRSSLTGHLLLSTIHTNSAWGSVARLTDMGVHPYLIADTLKLCVAQRLIRLLCPHCRIRTENPLASYKEGAGTFYKAGGCEHCFYTGYAGRRAIYEVIPVDGFLKDAAGKNISDIEAYLKKQHISTLKDAAWVLYTEGKTSLDEILPIINDSL